MHPEEIVRQEYIRILHQDFDYPLEHIEKEISIQRGNIQSKKKQKRKSGYRNI